MIAPNARTSPIATGREVRTSRLSIETRLDAEKTLKRKRDGQREHNYSSRTPQGSRQRTDHPSNSDPVQRDCWQQITSSDQRIATCDQVAICREMQQPKQRDDEASRCDPQIPVP